MCGFDRSVQELHLFTRVWLARVQLNFGRVYLINSSSESSVIPCCRMSCQIPQGPYHDGCGRHGAPVQSELRAHGGQRDAPHGLIRRGPTALGGQTPQAHPKVRLQGHLWRWSLSTRRRIGRRGAHLAPRVHAIRLPTSTVHVLVVGVGVGVLIAATTSSQERHFAREHQSLGIHGTISLSQKVILGKDEPEEAPSFVPSLKPELQTTKYQVPWWPINQPQQEL